MKLTYMKHAVLFVLTFLLVTACSGVVTFEVEENQQGYSGNFDVLFDQTPVPPTPSPVPTQPEPTPTQEVLEVVRLTANANIRSQPLSGSSIVRTAPVGTQFTVFRVQGDWLDVGEGWLFRGSWVVEVADAPDGGVLQSRVGYNTLEVFNESYYMNHLQDLCPKYMLVMDNINLAKRVYDTLNPSCGTEVIHRNYSNFEGDEYLFRTPQEIVSNWQREGYPELIRYSTNEPACGGGRSCEGLVAHEVELARVAREAGFTVALGNLGVGKHLPQEVTAGVFNPLIKAIVDYDHLFSPHEYTFGCLCFGFGTMPRDALLNRNAVQPELWYDDVSFDFVPFGAQTVGDDITFGQEMMAQYSLFAQSLDAQQCGGSLPSYWHLGRSFWILLWAECTLGIDTSQIEVVHTEWGWDNLSDISDVISTLRQQFADPAFENNLRGWRSLHRVWDYYYPTQSTAQSAYEQIAWAISQYPDNHSFLLFAWSDDAGRDWTKAGFSFGNWGDPDTIELHSYLTALKE